MKERPDFSDEFGPLVWVWLGFLALCAYEAYQLYF
jgi:hypothetical protein